ncbi:MAG: GNAT family N-acetyltransferase [Gammaproteobacteria bacterium]|nr:GNAT family N-acetyltransferase [Gammaproteobacteria bacterium]
MPNLTFKKNKTTGELHVNLETERLYIESVTTAYLYDYANLLGNPDVMTKFGDGKAWDFDYTKNRVGTWVERWNANDPFSSLSISKNDDDNFIGHVVLGYGDEPGQAEIAYVFDKSTWGHGYGKEAVSAVVNEYAPELIRQDYQVKGKDFTSITATARPDNEASVRILKSVGMKPIREEVKYGHNRQVFFMGTDELRKELPKEPAKMEEIKQPHLNNNKI